MPVTPPKAIGRNTRRGDGLFETVMLMETRVGYRAVDISRQAARRPSKRTLAVLLDLGQVKPQFSLNLS